MSVAIAEAWSLSFNIVQVADYVQPRESVARYREMDRVTDCVSTYIQHGRY